MVTDMRRHEKRLLKGYRWLLIAASNQLPFRLCQSIRQFLLRSAGVRFRGRCFIRGPIYIQNPDKLTIGVGCVLNGHIHFENAAPVEIGDFSGIGPGGMFFTMNHFGDYPRSNDALPIRVGRRAWLAGAVRVLPGVDIGDDAVVATGSVVFRDVAPGTSVSGNPARPFTRLTAPRQRVGDGFDLNGVDADKLGQV